MSSGCSLTTFFAHLQVALGGPIGAIIGGLVANAATGATLEMIDEKVQHKKTESVLAIEDSKETARSNDKTIDDSEGRERS